MRLNWTEWDINKIPLNWIYSLVPTLSLLSRGTDKDSESEALFSPHISSIFRKTESSSTFVHRGHPLRRQTGGETNKVVCKLRRDLQACSQPERSGRVALVQGCEKQTLSASIFFSIQFCYVFLVSMCRGEWDLGLCMTLKLAERMRLLSADFWFRNVFGRWIRRKSALRSRILIASSKVMPGSRSDSPLHFDFKNRYPANLYKKIIY